MEQLEPLPVHALAYQLPADAAAGPWAVVARGVGWAAAALAAAQLAAALFGLAFWAGMSGRGVSVAGAWLMASGVNLLHAPVLIGGVACARLRPYGWKLLTYSLWVVLGAKALLLLLLPIMGRLRGAPWGIWGMVGQIGQTAFSTVGTAVPILLFLWILRQPGVRQLFTTAEHLSWVPEQQR